MKKFTINTVLKRLLPLILAAVLMQSPAVFASDSSADDSKNLEYLKSIMDLLKEQYKGEITDAGLAQGAINGMFNSLDPYTTFFTPSEAESFLGNISGSFSGIGVALELSGDYIVITRVYSGSPAEKAGILQGDRIVEADGKSLIGKTTDEAVSLIKGAEGTKVRLGILRTGKQDVRYFDILRETIKLNPVRYEIRDGIGYISLEMFNENADEFIGKALAEMDKNHISKIVLDLRNNPGGEVGVAVAIARRFVPAGVITTLDYKSESHKDVVYKSYLEKSKYKLAVLVNGMSASASEILSGAIQDTAAGSLVGTKTFGKAKFQGILPILTQAAFEKYEGQLGVKLVDAYELAEKYGVSPLDSEISGYAKITLGLYYTPKGRMIDGTGLTPDYRVDDPALVNEVDVNSVQKLTGTVKPGLNGQGTDVYNAEKILKMLGYSVDAPDTTLDAKTFEAIKQFQKNNKFYAYGILDFSTQKALNDALDKTILQTDKQYAKAVEVLNKE